MSFGLIALLLAGAGAGWLLFRLARGQGAGGTRNMNVLKGVVWFGLIAALAVAKLWPLAFMVLIAASGVMAIEMWRDRAVKEDEALNAAGRQMGRPPTKSMDIDEAAAVLGVSDRADADEIRAAHKKLISQIHPDKGGTDYLAAKINEARDVMLGGVAGD